MVAKCQMIYHHGNCLNTKKAFAPPCRICVDRCPHQAISEYRDIDASKCTECGICMAACPSDGFVDRMADKLDKILDTDKEEIVLNCPQAQPLGLEIPCLGVLDRDTWSTLLLLAGRKAVQLVTGDCSACLDKKACAGAVKIFKELHADWPEHPPLKILIRPDTGEASSEPGQESDGIRAKKTSPAFGINELRKKSIKAMENMLLEYPDEEETYAIPLSRQWLSRELEKNPQEKIPYRALTVTKDCTGCGVCVTVCPQGALTQREEQDKRQLIFEPLKCIHCERCVKICRVEAVTFANKLLSARVFNGKVLVHEGILRTCSQCGRTVYDHSVPPLCFVCVSSYPDHRASNPE